MPSYYAVSSETGQIVESVDYLTSEVEKWAQQIADDLGEEVWVIQGEHTGITVHPGPGSEVEDEAPLLKCERNFLSRIDIEAQKAATAEALRRWNEGLGIPGYSL